uniref:NUC153 domain-containing protein n=1 Tax=Panagrolaimus sp. JU765 TaxID=591449 RepID=A0AC34RMI5_9BILA
MSEKLEDDDRFKEVSHLTVFNEMRRNEQKVQVDSRFKEMFTNKDFGIGRVGIDLRGRPLHEDQIRGVTDLYEYESEEEDKDEKIVLDLARGAGNMYSSDEDSEDTVDSEMEDDVDKDNEMKVTVWDKLNSHVKHVEWASKRLAICNMDWDKIRAEDLFLVLNSFKPPSGKLLKLSIYLSDFGAERVKKEMQEGPQINPIDDSKKDKEAAEVEAVRHYQFERMKYYYAIAEFDSIETATHIYEQCDRMEYESSGIQLDLRFVPDETTFDEERLREGVEFDSMNPSKFKPSRFTGSFASTRPKLTWDEDNRERKEKLGKAAKENLDNLSDFDDLVAGSDEDDEPDKDAMNALFEAAGIGREQEESIKVDWTPIAKGSDEEMVSDNEETMAAQPKKKKGGTFDDFLERRKMVRKERKAKVKELKQKAKEENIQFQKLIAAQVSEKKKLKKAEKAMILPANINDERFAALFESADYAIDKADKRFKGGNLADQQVQIRAEKKRKQVHKLEENPEIIDSKSLVEKLKMKAGKMKKLR